MELRNDKTPDRRLPANRSDQVGSKRDLAKIKNARQAHEASLRDTIERVSRSTEDSSARLQALGASNSGDRIELSDVARRIVEGGAEERKALVDELRRAHSDGTLNSRGRVERAAARLLGDQ